MPERKNVMISSTARDLPEHRKEVLDACLRQGMFPLMMEHLPASDADAIRISMEMVDKADIYLLILAHRYGTLPAGHGISITEMEYNRAVARKIPRLCLIIDKDHPIKIEDVDIENAAKLKAFKERVQNENIVNFFKSPADLRAHVINSLSNYREANLTAFHYVSDIPAPPEAYIAHPYTLLQTGRLIGRQAELNLLTDWVTKRHEQIYWARILNIVAIGGMGKSALTWKWFNDIAPQEMKPLAGRMWWSFYESDASFENFVIRALAYVTQRPREEVQKIAPSEREAQLLAALDCEPFLLVLDGLERILMAYARMDATHLADDDIDQRTANYVAKAYGLPKSAAQSFIGQHLLRKTADPRAGSFLRKLANVRAARILVSTRLYPADLQTAIGEPIHGCSAIFLPGLRSMDALELWRSFGVSGEGHILLPIFDTFDNHPLLIQILAGEIANYRRAPGDFERWQKDHPNFNPFNLLLVNVRAHVLEYALRGLYKKARTVLETIAAFRIPASYNTLAALFVGESKLFPTEPGLDVALTELEDRGLVGWDKRANRYDLHPIVRGVVWNGLKDQARRNVYKAMHEYFESFPKIDLDEDSNLEELAFSIELYSTLIGLRRYDDAYAIFCRHLRPVMLHRLSACYQLADLTEMLFPNRLDKVPRLRSVSTQADVIDTLAMCYHFTGQLGRAIPLYSLATDLWKSVGERVQISGGFSDWAYTLYLTGALYDAETIAARSQHMTHRRIRFTNTEAICWLGLVLATRGITDQAKSVLRRFLRTRHDDYLGNLCLAQLTLWLVDFSGATSMAINVFQRATRNRDDERNVVRAARLCGDAAQRLDDLETAYERLHYALIRARSVNLVEEELPALVALAELRRRQGDLKAARELLDDVWEPAERGPYPLFHADAFNVLTQIERDAGNNAAAVDAATKAYRLAWCDGEPYAYHWGLVAARKHLRELGAPEPPMPPFDESKYEPMPEVEINPKDEFYVDV